VGERSAKGQIRESRKNTVDSDRQKQVLEVFAQFLEQEIRAYHRQAGCNQSARGYSPPGVVFRSLSGSDDEDDDDGHPKSSRL